MRGEVCLSVSFVSPGVWASTCPQEDPSIYAPPMIWELRWPAARRLCASRGLGSRIERQWIRRCRAGGLDTDIKALC